MYQYWTPVYSEEHFLYAKEIAPMFGIQTKTGNIHNRLVSALLKEYCRENNIMPLFYFTKNGPREVFSKETYTATFHAFIRDIGSEFSGTITIDNKKYHYMMSDFYLSKEENK